MAALSGGHTALQFAMSLVSLQAGQIFEASRAELDARNMAILESDPALAKRIASMASKGGGTALVISHLIAVGPPVAIAYNEMRSAARARQAKREEEQAQLPMDFE